VESRDVPHDAIVEEIVSGLQACVARGADSRSQAS
jgi:hypothetical protein